MSNMEFMVFMQTCFVLQGKNVTISHLVESNSVFFLKET